MKKHIELLLIGFILVIFLSASAFGADPAGCPKLSFSTPYSLPDATFGRDYQFQFLTVGGKTPITFTFHPSLNSMRPPDLREKMTLSTSGLLTSNNLPEGKLWFLVVATDSCQPIKQTAIGQFILTVTPPKISGGADKLKGDVPKLNPNIPRNIK